MLFRSEADIPTCDLLVCITNTRSMTQDKAISESLYIGKALTEKGINHIFKKTDSVLRGHVAAELKALMKVTGKTQTLLLPANPSLGRQIIGGKYYINDIPIMETAFSYDPEFPAKSNEVLALLGEGQLVNATESISTTITNILIGNVSKEEELEAYCQKLTAEILPAGGSSYFKAYLTWLLEVNSIESISSKLQLDKLLLICGSTIKHNALLEELKQANVPIESMPLNVYNGSASPNEWIEFLNKQYALHGNLVVMINHPISSDRAYALRLKRIMAQVCNDLLERQTVKEMIIEGGATAYEVDRKSVV